MFFILYKKHLFFFFRTLILYLECFNMARTNGSSLFFDEQEIHNTPNLIPRLIRILFFRFGITNDDYLDRYERYFRERHPHKTRKELTLEASSNRKALFQDRRKLTFNKFKELTEAMGYDVETVMVSVRDRATGEIITLSTDDTPAKLLKMRNSHDMSEADKF